MADDIVTVVQVRSKRPGVAWVRATVIETEGRARTKIVDVPLKHARRDRKVEHAEGKVRTTH